MDKVYGYLLDTNVISILADKTDPRHQKAREFEQTLQPGHVTISAITAGEIEFGLQRIPKPDSKQQKQLNAMRLFLDRYRGDMLNFDEHTAEPYGLIRAKLWSKYSTKKKRKRPEDLRDASGKELGIDERDLLIVSIAAQYRYVFVTADVESMRVIENAVNVLKSEMKPVDVTFNYWKF